MDDYSTALAAHLASGVTQDDFAARIKRTQAAVSRYVSGARFPDAATAQLIDVHTDGAVPFGLWQRLALSKLGIPSDQAA